MSRGVMAVLAAAACLAAALALSLGEDPTPPRLEASRAPAAGAALHGYIEIGEIPTGLLEPRAIAVDERSGTPVVLVAGDSTIRKLGPDGSLAGEIALSFEPYCVAVATPDRLLVCAPDHVEAIGASAQVLQRWLPAEERSMPRSIAVTPGAVFVGDAGAMTVLRYDHAGKLLGRIAEKDEARGIPGIVVYRPYLDLFALPDRLVVANPGRHRLELYTFEGAPLGAFGTYGTAPERFCGCCNPINIAPLPGGRIVTAEKAIARVKVLAADGRLDSVVAGPSWFEPGTEGLDVATDAAGKVFVLDPVSKKVRIFERLKEAHR